jgi:hypothetical protein
MVQIGDMSSAPDSIARVMCCCRCAGIGPPIAVC